MKNKKKKTKIVVLYHNNCPDGFGAAWAAWKKFGNKADYVGVNHMEPPPKGLSGKDIYLVDFCYGADETRRMQKIAKSLTIIDHHVSRKTIILSVPRHSYALHHSGSVLAWQYFHPAQNVPTLLKYVEDVDLWKFKLSKTHELVAYLDVHLKYSFKIFDIVAHKFENKEIRSQCAHDGGIILQYQKVLIDDAIKNSAEFVKFFGYTVLAANSPFIHSEIGNALARKHGPFSIVWSKKYWKIIVSLRSMGDFDVSRLAARYGGGGHKNASGFSFPDTTKFPWEPLKK